MVLRAKYFKNTDVLNSKLGYGPSMIWRSIWGSMKLLKEGLVWRVGNGLNIKVWGDKWLPNKPSHRVQSPIKFLNAEAKVTELIGNDGKWNREVVKATVNEEEAEVICNIPMSYSGLEDKRIWAYSKNGYYSVRSAYHLDISRKKDSKGEPSDGRKIKEGWRELWQLNTSGVVKNFLWKALNNCLPTNENLYRRKVVKKPVCPICLREDETVCHVLWSCPATMDVWAEKESPVQKWKSSEVDLAEVWRKLIAELPLDSMEMVVSVMRYIWLRRNGWIFERKFTSPGSVLQQARANLNEFQQAQQKGIERNKTAAVEMGSSKRRLCEELNIQKAVLEGDSLEVIKVVNDREECLEWHGQIIEDIKGILCIHPNWILKHTFREGNRLAHFLGQFAIMFSEELVWIEDGPEGFFSIVLQDKICNDTITDI
ncbi:hypothetical protein F2P56_034576 [Juglans regia]|uniref:Uncharacterized protein n=2 Tax=Juglans regia TaxID=51240 RepID=A0A833U7G2_JUGRE|nr:uncharacterized protein LOC108993046 [Juglans regia]KAF5445530.1 hypothetical protein F2P56_034576 [Juglans regia]